MRTSVATTVQPGIDHIGPLERAQTDVTVVRRAADLAELLAAARSGLVDAVLVAGGIELLSRGFLEEIGRAPRPVGVLALSDVRQERERVRALGVPCLRADAEPLELARAIQDVAGAAAQGTPPPVGPAEEVPPGEELPDAVWDADGTAPPFEIEVGPQNGGAAGTSAWTVPAAALAGGDADVTGAGRASVGSDVADPAEAAPEAIALHDPAPDAPDGPAPAPAAERPEGAPVQDHAGGPQDVAHHSPEPASVVAVWGPAGAPGRTTVAVNLAAETALAGLRTLLVDLDTYGPAVGAHLGLTEESAGVSRAAHRAERGRLTTADLATSAVRVRVAGAPLDVLTGLTRPDRWTEVRPAAVAHILQVARERWDRVIVDVGFNLEEDEELSFDVPAPQRNGSTLTVLSAADRILAVGGADAVALPRLLRALETFPETVDAARVEVVMNRVRPSAAGISPESQVAAVWARYGPAAPIVAHLPWDPQAADHALLGGQVLAEVSPSGRLRRAVAALARTDPAVSARAAAAGGRRSRRGAVSARSGQASRRRLLPWPAPSPRTP